MKKFYLHDRKALAFFEEQATPNFWEQRWESETLAQGIRVCTNDGVFIPMVKKYLPKGSFVLEGGCGQGHIVHALQYNKYRAVGLDFAQNTVRAVKQAVPELTVTTGDVFQLPFPSANFDGYISAGVIEHFWDGYQPILAEMARVLRPGGMLFVSFPAMSLLRQLKAFLHQYPVAAMPDMETERDTFYQFALSPQLVIRDIEAAGFHLIKRAAYDGIKGGKDEIPILKPSLQAIYDGQKHQKLRRWIDTTFKPFAAHMALLVMQKQA